MGRKSRGRMERLVTIRCSSEEYAELQRRAQAAGLPMAEWARSLLLAGHPARDASPEAEDDASR